MSEEINRQEEEQIEQLPDQMSLDDILAMSADAGSQQKVADRDDDGEEDDINIEELEIDELLELMGEDLYDGYADEVVEEVNEALSRGMTPYNVLTQGLVAGMEIVGVDFRDGILFVPEVLMAAKAMKAGMAILRPLLAQTGAPPPPEEPVITPPAGSVVIDPILPAKK